MNCIQPFRILLAAFVLGGVATSTKSDDGRPNEKLEAAIDSLVAAEGIGLDDPGLAVLIHQPNRLQFQKGYGLAELKTKRPITSLTMFELASVSKSFTGTAVMILHDRGVLSIDDDDVRKYLPELPVYDKAHPIHLRDMLQHVSGLPDYLAFQDVPSKAKNFWVNEDYAPEFATRLADFPLRFSPRQKYHYNNTNYMLLGLIISRVSKKSYGEFLRDEIFIPAGMKHTFVYERPAAVPKESESGANRAVGYEWRKARKTWEPGWGAPPDRHEKLLVVGDGGIWSNLEDMARWDLAVREERFLKPATWKRALLPSKTQNGKSNEYGFGWTTYREKSGDLIGYGHEGAWGGFITSYYRYLQADRTTIILSNRGSLDTNKFWNKLDRIIERHLMK